MCQVDFRNSELREFQGKDVRFHYTGYVEMQFLTISNFSYDVDSIGDILIKSNNRIVMHLYKGIIKDFGFTYGENDIAVNMHFKNGTCLIMGCGVH